MKYFRIHSALEKALDKNQTSRSWQLEGQAVALDGREEGAASDPPTNLLIFDGAKCIFSIDMGLFTLRLFAPSASPQTASRPALAEPSLPPSRSPNAPSPSPTMGGDHYGEPFAFRLSTTFPIIGLCIVLVIIVPATSFIHNK